MMRVVPALCLSMLTMAAACGDDESSSVPFEIKFAAEAAGKPVSCDALVTGLGPAGAHSIGISDLRFYVGSFLESVHFTNSFFERVCESLVTSLRRANAFHFLRAKFASSFASF